MHSIHWVPRMGMSAIAPSCGCLSDVRAVNSLCDLQALKAACHKNKVKLGGKSIPNTCCSTRQVQSLGLLSPWIPV